MKSIMSVAAGMLVFAVGTAVVTPVRAADLSLPSKEPVVVSPTPWTGFYLGGNVGYAWGHEDYSGAANTPGGPVVATYSGGMNTKGVLGGAFAGFNYEFQSHVVVGIESDFEFAGITGTSANSIESVQTQEFGTLEARLGYAWNNVLLYGAGGGAWLNNKGTVTLPSGNTDTETTTPAGYSYGGGIEWLVLPNWTVRAEYIHVQFVNQLETYNLGLAGTTNFIANNQTNTNIDAVRVGFTYLFTLNPPAIAARY